MKYKDEKIIELLFARSETALGIIQELYGRLIRSTAFNIFKSDTVADECLNDTLLDIWNKIPPEKPRSLASFACTIARRRAIDRYRRETAQKRHISDESEYHSVYEELAFLDDISDGVIDRMEMKRIVNEFVHSQSSLNRDIFVSRFYNFESLDSISARLHISKNILAGRLHRMRCDLAEKFKKEGMPI